VSVLIRKITLAALMAAIVGGTLALPASSNASPVAHAAKCKKGKKAKKKKKKCKGAGQSGNTLPGQATHPSISPGAGVSGVSLAVSPVLAGTGTTGLVTISDAAPSAGQAVTLQSSDQSRVTVPGSVVVAGGQTTANFSVGTTAGSNVNVTITAAIGTSNATTQLNVVSTPSVQSLSLARQCFTPGSFSGSRVTLDVTVPVDTNVGLSSDDPAALDVSPGSATVPAGSRTGYFGVTAGNANPLVTVTATLGSSSAFDTTSVNGSSTVPTLTGVTVQPSTIPVGTQATGTVTLDCEAGPGGVQVDLSSDQAGVAAPAPGQSPVLVPAGQLSAPFTVNTSSIGNANIIATFGPTTLQAPVTVIPIDT
jgi:trimeric autotransporter adhesin